MVYITNAQLLEQDPVLANNPQFGQEGVVFRVPYSEGSNKETLKKHLKVLLFKTVLRARVIFHFAFPGRLEVFLSPPRDCNIDQVGFLSFLIEDNNVWPALSLAMRDNLVKVLGTTQKTPWPREERLLNMNTNQNGNNNQFWIITPLTPSLYNYIYNNYV